MIPSRELTYHLSSQLPLGGDMFVPRRVLILEITGHTSIRMFFLMTESNWEGKRYPTSRRRFWEGWFSYRDILHLGMMAVGSAFLIPQFDLLHQIVWIEEPQGSLYSCGIQNDIKLIYLASYHRNRCLPRIHQAPILYELVSFPHVSATGRPVLNLGHFGHFDLVHSLKTVGGQRKTTGGEKQNGLTASGIRKRSF